MLKSYCSLFNVVHPSSSFPPCVLISLAARRLRALRQSGGPGPFPPHYHWRCLLLRNCISSRQIIPDPEDGHSPPPFAPSHIQFHPQQYQFYHPALPLFSHSFSRHALTERSCSVPKPKLHRVPPPIRANNQTLGSGADRFVWTLICEIVARHSARLQPKSPQAFRFSTTAFYALRATEDSGATQPPGEPASTDFVAAAL